MTNCNGVTPGPAHDCDECCTSHCPPTCPGYGSTDESQPLPIPSARELRSKGLFAAGPNALNWPGLA